MESRNTRLGVVQQEEKPPEERLQCFLRWMRVNGVSLHGSKIKCCLEDTCKGFGVYATHDETQGVVMVTPLNLAITPMTVLQDPSLGVEYGKLFEGGDVDDRMLMILFLLVERARGNSSFWSPYLDMLPTNFGTPLWFTEQELQDLKGSALYNATKIQLKNLRALFDDKVKPLVEHFLSICGVLGRNVEFHDLLWANSLFWTRALNIPCPPSFVFPKQLPTYASVNTSSEMILPVLVNYEHNGCAKYATERADQSTQHDSIEIKHEREHEAGDCNKKDRSALSVTVAGKGEETVWVEGLVPGIDFCNHGQTELAQWEVDGDGSTTGVPYSMYLVTGPGVVLKADEEIQISYGNKGNEELLFLYGFVMENNSDDYLMVHYPKEALDMDNSAEAKLQLLERQKLSLRWLFPMWLLQNGVFTEEVGLRQTDASVQSSIYSGYSWSGHRKPPSYVNHLVFPEETLAALRVLAMKVDDVHSVMSLLQELSETDLQRSPSGEDMRAAVWEVCGNTGALQLLSDLLVSRLIELEEGTGPEDSDSELLDKHMESLTSRNSKENSENEYTKSRAEKSLPLSKRACILYRKGQKFLARRFLKQAEHLLDLCIAEESDNH